MKLDLIFLGYSTCIGDFDGDGVEGMYELYLWYEIKTHCLGLGAIVA